MTGDSGGSVTGRIPAETLTSDDLPPPDVARWIARKKAQVVAAIRDGLISREDACNRYRLSNAELFSWEELLDQHGLKGLRVSRIQQYRRMAPLLDAEANGQKPRGGA